MATTDTAPSTNGTMPAGQPQEEPTTVEMGVGIIMPFGAWGDEAELTPNMEITLEQLEQMRKKDGQARALLRLLTLPILAALKRATWEPFDDSGQEEAEFIEQMFTLPPAAGGMTKTLNRFMAELLLGISDSYSVFEEVYWSPASGPLKGKWTLRKLARRPASTITFLVDKNGGFAGVKQRTQFQGREVNVSIPAHKVLYYAANEEENPFYGVSFFLPAYYHFDKKQKLYYIAHLAAQHRAVPGRVGTLPPGSVAAQDKTAFQKALKDYGLMMAMMLPDGFNVEELGGHLAQFPWLDIIDHHNTQMSKSVLAQFLDSDENKNALVDFSGSDAEFYMLLLDAIMEDIESRINNHTIPKFIDWNFGTGLYPAFHFGAVTDQQKQAIRDVFSTLGSATTLQVTPDFMFELERKLAEVLDLELDYDELQAEFEEQKKLKLEMSQAAGKAAIEAANNPQPEAPAPGQQPPPAAPVKPGKSPAKGEKISTTATEDDVLDPPLIRLSDLAAQVLEDIQAQEADDNGDVD